MVCVPGPAKAGEKVVPITPGPEKKPPAKVEVNAEVFELTQ